MKNLLTELWRPSASLGNSENPFNELRRMQRQMERMFDVGPATSSQWAASLPEFAPACDIEETESHYLMSFDLPGVKKEDVKISLHDNILNVSGECQDTREDRSKNRYSSERFHGMYSRSFTLPEGVKAEQIESEYKDGVLHIAVPKTVSAKKQEIRIGEGKTGFFNRFWPQRKEAEKRPAERVA